MNSTLKKAFTLLLALSVAVSTFALSGTALQADTPRLSLGTISIVDGTNTSTAVADLTSGEKPKLYAGTTYALKINYSIPAGLREKDTYVKITLGDGLYYEPVAHRFRQTQGMGVRGGQSRHVARQGPRPRQRTDGCRRIGHLPAGIRTG